MISDYHEASGKGQKSMFLMCHTKTLGRTAYVVLLFAFFGQPSFSQTNKKAQKREPAAITFDELDQAEPTRQEEETPAGEVREEGEEPAPQRQATRRSRLPTIDQLVEAKLKALQKKQEEQAEALAVAEKNLAQEVENEKRIFDTNAYLDLSIKNTAPADYELRKTEVYVDGRLVLRGGKRNNGLPRTLEIFTPIEPGCHDIQIKAVYRRLKNDLISRIKVNRIEHLTKNIAFIAKNGYRVEVNIEGFEEHNSLVNWKRGPALRFNRSVRPNFVEGAPIVSMDDVLKQGQLHLEYLTEANTHHRLIEKSLSIDGLPILVTEKHDPVKDRSIVYDGPLAEGKHTLNVVLLFGEQKWVKGGPLYNFRLSFNRDFYVISGQKTIINLAGMPHDGFKSSVTDSRYARATSSIRSKEHAEMFSDMTCKEQRKKIIEEIAEKNRQEKERLKKEAEKAKAIKPALPPAEGALPEAVPEPVPGASSPAAEPGVPPPEATPKPVEPVTPPAQEPVGTPAEGKPESVPLLPKPTEVPSEVPSPPVIVPQGRSQSINEKNQSEAFAATTGG